jgi:hypothetical protein
MRGHLPLQTSCLPVWQHTGEEPSLLSQATHVTQKPCSPFFNLYGKKFVLCVGSAAEISAARDTDSEMLRRYGFGCESQLLTQEDPAPNTFV